MNALYFYLIGCFVFVALCVGLDSHKYKTATQIMFIASAPWWVTLTIVGYGAKAINYAVMTLLLSTFRWVGSIQNEKA